ncbi:hypothetical protein QBC38DRAFT_548351 [Podospora fimiseda]|uniref:MARVEL domain-containing protein n=1 Tax=Podospora fimiseda TaxID=252190 RepID=A0AAN7BHX9_9PEZI|nr:hypothetical protein QBC38DRAFT_548351 [Podospora fimiseda]
MTTPMASPAPPHVSPQGMWISKLCLRFFQFVFAFTMISLMGSMMSTFSFYSFTSLFFAGPATVLSIIWTISESICILKRGGHRGIHPGANVALDLIIWLLFIPATAALTFISVLSSVDAAYDDDTTSSSSSSSGGSSSNPYSSSSSSYSGSSDYSYGGLRANSGSMGIRARDPYDEEIKDIAAKGEALVVLGAFLVILHFVTFVIACVETHKRRRKRKQTVVIVERAAEQGFGGQKEFSSPSTPSSAHLTPTRTPVQGQQFPAPSPLSQQAWSNNMHRG